MGDVTELLQVRGIANRSEDLIALSSALAIRSGGVMRIYLFWQRRTDDLARTSDVTGRNIPPVTSSTDWLFVEALDTNKFWHIADLQGVLRQLKVFGYYIWGPRAQ